MKTSSMIQAVNRTDLNQPLIFAPRPGRRIRHIPMTLAVALLILLAWADVSHANGIPVQIFLDHVPLKTTWDAASGGRGVAVVSANDEQVRVMAQNLPAPPDGANYYAWLEQVDGSFLPVGPLLYQNDGTASIDQSMPGLPYSENFSWVLVSLENPQAVGSTPSPEIALAGRLPNAEALPLSGNDAPQLLPVTGASTRNPAPALPLVMLIGIVFVIGLIGAIRVYGQQRSHALMKIHADEAASTQKFEKRP